MPSPTSKTPNARDLVVHMATKCSSGSWKNYSDYFDFLKKNNLTINNMLSAIKSLLGGSKPPDVFCFLFVMDDNIGKYPKYFKTKEALQGAYTRGKYDPLWKKFIEKIKYAMGESFKKEDSNDEKFTSLKDLYNRSKAVKAIRGPVTTGNITENIKGLLDITSPEKERQRMIEEEAAKQSEAIDSRASQELTDIYNNDILYKEAIWPFGELGSWIGGKAGEGIASTYKNIKEFLNPPPEGLNSDLMDNFKKEIIDNYKILGSLVVKESLPSSRGGVTTPTKTPQEQETLKLINEYRVLIKDKFITKINDIIRGLEVKSATKQKINTEEIIKKLLEFYDNFKNFLDIEEPDFIIKLDILKNNLVNPSEYSNVVDSSNKLKNYYNTIIEPKIKVDIGLASSASDGHIKNKNKKSIKNNQKNTKSANSKTSNVLYKNKDQNIMKKKADKFSKNYYRDAVSGLDDQEAKSYYAGLKGMYDKKQKKTKADYTKLYELHDESGPDLIGSAHPKTIDIAEAMGNGGVVENQIEQQRHNIGVAQSMPSGNFQGKHAWVIHNLVKLAEYADKIGDEESSDLIDNALEELSKF